MGSYFLFFILVLFITAAALREDLVFSIVYLLAGGFILGRWWSGEVIKNLRVKRIFEQRMFIGESQTVRIRITNRSWLPAAWINVQESLPLELGATGPFQYVFSIPGKEKITAEYRLEARRRGYYPIGPLKITSGDVFGVVEGDVKGWETEYITVYPQVVPLVNLPLPSNMPLGILRSHQPIYQDPTRITGKREYIAGDSLRSVDWKTTAATGVLQVKKFEPAISLETTLFLDLNLSDYPPRRRYDVPELAISTAASLAYYIISRRQAVGMVTNGIDILGESKPAQPVPLRRGQAHLMRILEILARVQPGETITLAHLLSSERLGLPWGSTLVAITPRVGESLFESLFQVQRSGIQIVLVPVGPVVDLNQARQKAALFGIPFFPIQDLSELERWQIER